MKDRKDYLDIKNIYFDYQSDNNGESEGSEEYDRIVLTNINFSVKKCEFVAIIGPSGCGKTTLLKIIAGFLKADRGVIYKNGEEVSGSAPDRIMVFQEFRQLFPWKTVLGNVTFALKAKNIGGTSAAREQIAREYLKKVKLFDVFDYYPHQLSGGMKQRTALARTLAADPEIMLMDEPFGSLDSQTRTALQHLLLDIWQEARKTILFVTHDIREAIILADRIIVMGENPGHIKEIIGNSLSRPRNEVSVEFTQMYKTIANI